MKKKIKSILLICLSILLIAYIFYALSVWNYGSNSNLTNSEEDFIGKNSTKYYKVDLYHNPDVVSPGKIGYTTTFSVNVESLATTFDFNSMSNDSLTKLSNYLNSEAQKIMSHKDEYDSLKVSVITIKLDNSNQGELIFSKNFLYKIR